jgi:hypothetical protein
MRAPLLTWPFVTMLVALISSEAFGRNVSTRKLADGLPQLGKTEPRMVKPGKIPVKLTLPAGWKINESAPSWLALFKVDQLMMEFGRDQLKSRQIVLDHLVKTQTYRLQGTLYYCQTLKGSVCRIQSVDQRISVEPSGDDFVEIFLDTGNIHR